MDQSEDPFFATTIISAEEQMRGWLARIHAARGADAQVELYSQLAWLIEFLADWQIIAFDQQVATSLRISNVCGSVSERSISRSGNIRVVTAYGLDAGQKRDYLKRRVKRE